MAFFSYLCSKIIEIMQFDYSILKAINFDGSFAYDSFWALYTDKYTWIPLAVVAVFCLLYKGGLRHALIMILSLALLFLLSDFVVSSVIKELVARPRPSHDPLIMDALSYVDDYRGGAYGFPSNHASNGFAIATFLTLLYRNRIICATTFLWAAGSCYSRMYMGVHFPTDILVGALLGSLFAVIAYRIYIWACTKYGVSPDTSLASRPYAQWALPCTFFLTVAALLIGVISI